MKWNKNPFKKNTPVSVFSNTTEAEYWKDNNCYKCQIYETESTEPEEAGCKLAFYIDLGFLNGEMPLWVMRDIGCEYNPLYQQCSIYDKCRKFQDPDLPF